MDDGWMDEAAAGREGGEVNHQTASVKLKTDADHICQVSSLKADTWSSDGRPHPLHRRTAEEARFKQTNHVQMLRGTVATVTALGSDPGQHQ